MATGKAVTDNEAKLVPPIPAVIPINSVVLTEYILPSGDLLSIACTCKPVIVNASIPALFAPDTFIVNDVAVKPLVAVTTFVISVPVRV